jgi:DNA repair exonuclease SbcCD ATPase subunit
MIRRIRARNFRIFSDLQSPEFGEANIIIGPNGAGKSSLKDAICALLSGTATDCESGMGLDALRSYGAVGKKWQLDAQVEVAGTESVISRTESEGPKSSKQALIEKLINVSSSRARACLESGELLRLDGKARQKLLSDLAPEARVALPPGAVKGVSALLGESHQEIDLPTLDRLHKAAYELRADLAREVKAFGALELPQRPETARGGPEDPTEAIRVVRARITDLRRLREVKLAEATPKVRDDASSLAGMERAANHLAQEQARLARFPSAEEVASKTRELLAKLKDAEETNKEIEATRRKQNEELGVTQGSARRAKAALAALSDPVTKGKCPTCSYELGQKRKEKLELELKNHWESCEMEAQRIREQLHTTPDPLNLGEVQRQLERLDSDDKARAAAAGSVMRATEMVAQAKEALVRDTTEVPGSTEAAEEAEAIAGRIEAGERLLSDLVAFEATLRSVSDQLERLKLATEKHAKADELVRMLGPTGIRGSCANAGLSDFHDQLNSHLKWVGFDVDLRPAMDGVGYPSVTTRGKTLPLYMLSGGEQILFGGAFAIAVAKVTGLGIACVDDVERLDPESRDAFMGMVHGAGVQVFMFSVEREKNMSAKAEAVNSQRGRLRVFLMRNGELMAPGSVAREGVPA